MHERRAIPTLLLSKHASVCAGAFCSSMGGGPCQASAWSKIWIDAQAPAALRRIAPLGQHKGEEGERARASLASS
eukprot:6294371-Alexandrium_andersonii.AAC.1